METIVLFTNTDGKVGMLMPNLDCGLTLAEIIEKDLPSGATDVTITDHTALPADTMFSDSWSIVDNSVVEDLAKAKERAHTLRRIYRDSEFTPWDRKVTIPSESVAAEAEREAIRQKYTQIQTDIDNATDTDLLRDIVKSFI